MKFWFIWGLGLSNFAIWCILERGGGCHNPKIGHYGYTYSNCVQIISCTLIPRTIKLCWWGKVYHEPEVGYYYLILECHAMANIYSNYVQILHTVRSRTIKLDGGTQTKIRWLMPHFSILWLNKYISCRDHISSTVMNLREKVYYNPKVGHCGLILKLTCQTLWLQAFKHRYASFICDPDGCFINPSGALYSTQ